MSQENPTASTQALLCQPQPEETVKKLPQENMLSRENLTRMRSNRKTMPALRVLKQHVPVCKPPPRPRPLYAPAPAPAAVRYLWGRMAWLGDKWVRGLSAGPWSVGLSTQPHQAFKHWRWLPSECGRLSKAAPTNRVRRRRRRTFNPFEWGVRALWTVLLELYSSILVVQELCIINPPESLWQHSENWTFWMLHTHH